MNKYNFICKACIALGRDIGQIMFQKNAVSGYLMLIGIFFNSWTLAVLAIIGCTAGTATAYMAGYDRKEIKDGLYGFNGALSGIAAGIFLSGHIAVLMAAMLTSVLSTFITGLINRQTRIPGLTAPFIFTVWAMLAVCRWCFPEILSTGNNHTDITEDISWLKVLSFGIGQVMFQGNNLVTGLMFLGAIAINSRINAFYAVIGALLPIPLMLMLGAENISINEGLFGYNGVLCAIAIGEKSPKSFGWSIFAVCLSTLLQLWGMHQGITTLTAPFVLSVWATILLRRLLPGISFGNLEKQ
ncbi:MAG: urea transporter [Prevotellaceae bacterium]|nr:urea transporter [Prevotellaceae bacterium]